MSPNDQDDMMERRRRATPQELAMGTHQMIAAHMRMQREATEVPIEDGSLEGDEKEDGEVEEPQMNGPEFGHYQDRASQSAPLTTTEEESRGAEASRQRRISDASGKGHGAHREELKTPQRMVRGSAIVRERKTVRKEKETGRQESLHHGLLCSVMYSFVTFRSCRRRPRGSTDLWIL